WHTIVYAIITSGLKVVLGLLLAVLLTSSIRIRGLLRSLVFFPVLVSTVAVGITFGVLLAPDTGLVDTVLGWFGISGPDWLGSPTTALLSVALVDVWKGVGLASVIYKEYQAGFFGLATAGNVILFIFVTLIVYPLFRYMSSKEVDL